MNENINKDNLKQHCLHLLKIKSEALKEAFDAATEAGNNETKSTAGDKHETARAMMQLEQEKLSKQLNEVLHQENELSKLNTHVTPHQIGKGSLIQTDKGYFFIASSIGKISFEEKIVFVMSDVSPLGKLFIGLKSGDTTVLNGTNYQIISVK